MVMDSWIYVIQVIDNNIEVGIDNKIWYRVWRYHNNIVNQLVLNTRTMTLIDNNRTTIIYHRPYNNNNNIDNINNINNSSKSSRNSNGLINSII